MILVFLFLFNLLLNTKNKIAETWYAWIFIQLDISIRGLFIVGWSMYIDAVRPIFLIA
jgi:hypothetical protein